MMGSPLPLAPSVAVGRSVRGSQVARVATQHYGSPLSSPARPSRPLRSPIAGVHEMSRWSARTRSLGGRSSQESQLPTNESTTTDAVGRGRGRGAQGAVASHATTNRRVHCKWPYPAMPPRLVCLPAEVREEEALLSCNRVYDCTTPHISASLSTPRLYLLNPSTDHKNIPAPHLL